MREVMRADAVAALAHHEWRRLAVSVGNLRSVSITNGRLGSICERRAGGPVLGRPTWASTPHHGVVVHAQLAGDGADAPLLDME